MHNSIRFTCALFLLSASFGFAQSNPSSTNGNAGAASATGAAVNNGMSNAASGMSNAASAAGMGAMNRDPAVEANIQKMEQELDQGYKAHDAGPFTKYLDESIVLIFPGQMEQGKSAVIQGITSNPCTINSGVTSGFTYRWISADAVLVTYRGEHSETCQGKTMPSKDYNTSLWQKKGGAWVAVFHQITTGMPAAPAESSPAPSGGN